MMFWNEKAIDTESQTSSKTSQGEGRGGKRGWGWGCNPFNLFPVSAPTGDLNGKMLGVLEEWSLTIGSNYCD